MTPTPFAGAPMTDATDVPCSPPIPAGSCVFRSAMSGRPANSGCETSSPESTMVTGTPGPGGVRPSIPICESHHSCAWRGSGVADVAATSYVCSVSDAPTAPRSSSVCRSEPATSGRRRQRRSFASISCAPAAASVADSAHDAPAVSRTIVAAPARGRGRARSDDERRGCGEESEDAEGHDGRSHGGGRG